MAYSHHETDVKAIWIISIYKNKHSSMYSDKCICSKHSTVYILLAKDTLNELGLLQTICNISSHIDSSVIASDYKLVNLTLLKLETGFLCKWEVVGLDVVI